MGTRALGDRPWLVVDDRRDAELALKARLLDEQRDDVLLVAPRAIGDEVLELVRATGVALAHAADPLEAAARSIQEDLCLLRFRDGAWHLDGAALCFPSRWRLADKARRPLVEVHDPTPGYAEHLAPRVDQLLSRLTDRPVLRRNWFVHPDGALHQPTAPAVDPVVPAAQVLDDLYLRSERQTLRRLPSGWILFTIRIQQDTLGRVLTSDERRGAFTRYLAGAPADDLAHRGMAPAQVRELRLALGGPGGSVSTVSDTVLTTDGSSGSVGSRRDPGAPPEI